MSTQNWFVPIALILHWMQEGATGFNDFTTSDLATAIETMDVLHVDRFGRFKKATDQQKAEFLEQLADYCEAVNTISRSEDLMKIHEAAKIGHEELRDVANTIRDRRKNEDQMPLQFDRFGWMYESLRVVIGLEKVATVIANTPESRKANIVGRVNAMYAGGQSKESAYAAIAMEDGVKPGTIKKIYLR